MKIAIRSLAFVLAAAACACSKSDDYKNSPTTNDSAETPAVETPAEITPDVELAQPETPVVEAPAPVVEAAASGPVGTWKIDGAATLEANRAAVDAMVAQVPEGQRPMVLAMMTETFNAMDGTLVMVADNTLTGTMSMNDPMTGETEVTTLTGSWAKNGDAYTITSREDGKEVDETQTATITGSTLSMVAEGEERPMTLVFQRQS